MVASPLAATVVTAILRCDSCAAKFGTLIEKAQLFPVPALDKNQSPISEVFRGF